MTYDPITMCLSSALSTAVLANVALQAASDAAGALAGNAGRLLAVRSDASLALAHTESLVRALEGMLAEYSGRDGGAGDDAGTGEAGP